MTREQLIKSLRDWDNTTPEQNRRDMLAAADMLEADGGPVALQPTVEEAHKLGARGAEPTEAERLLFEAWMRGHCWALSAIWDGSTYRGTAEDVNYVCPRAMNTRQLWAAWRDRAALGSAPPPAIQERKPLSDEQIEQILVRMMQDGMRVSMRDFARAIEAANGITENKP